MRLTRVWLGLILLGCLCGSACNSAIVTLSAQTLPVSKTLVWDANPASDAVTNYRVSVDGTVIGSPTAPSQTITLATAGSHTLTVVAVNAWGDSLPSTLTVNVVVPGKPANLKLQ
jgi:hypothetical protein